MRSTAAIALIALLAAPSFAAPVASSQDRSANQGATARQIDSNAPLSQRDISALSGILNSVPSLSPEDKQTVKTALMNKLGTLQNVSQRGVGASLGGAALGGASSALVGNLLGEVCLNLYSL